MNKENLLLILLALLLLAGMLYTLRGDGNRSRHGYGHATGVEKPIVFSVNYGKPFKTG